MQSWDTTTLEAEPSRPKIVSSSADARLLLLLLTPWPAKDHDGTMSLEEKSLVRARAAERRTGGTA